MRTSTFIHPVRRTHIHVDGGRPKLAAAAKAHILQADPIEAGVMTRFAVRVSSAHSTIGTSTKMISYSAQHGGKLLERPTTRNRTRTLTYTRKRYFTLQDEFPR